MKKEKRERISRNVIFTLVPVLLVVLLVDSGVRFYIDNLPRPQVNVDYTIMSEFDDSLLDDTKETVK